MLLYTYLQFIPTKQVIAVTQETAKIALNGVKIDAEGATAQLYIHLQDPESMEQDDWDKLGMDVGWISNIQKCPSVFSGASYRVRTRFSVEVFNAPTEPAPEGSTYKLPFHTKLAAELRTWFASTA